MGEKNTIYYNGMELECIESGHWPDGVTLVGSDGCAHIFHERKVFYLRDGHAIFDGKENGTCWTKLSCWAIVPPKPSPRRLTNREIHKLWRKGWDIKNGSGLICTPEYTEDVEDIANTAVITLRAPGSDEWVEPTSNLLEVEK